TELPDDVLLAAEGRWKVVIDFPFDTEQRSPNDDHARIEAMLAAGINSDTVCWVPAFLTDDRMKDLGDLVCLNYLLASNDRFESNASHLSVQDRAQAKLMLENRRSALRQRLLDVVQQAYGVAKPQPADIDHTYGEPRWMGTLNPSFNPGAPVGRRHTTPPASPTTARRAPAGGERSATLSGALHRPAPAAPARPARVQVGAHPQPRAVAPPVHGTPYSDEEEMTPTVREGRV